MYTIANENLHHLKFVILNDLHFLRNSFRESNLLSIKTKASCVFSLLNVCWAASLRLPNMTLRCGHQIDLDLVSAVSKATCVSNGGQVHYSFCCPLDICTPLKVWLFILDLRRLTSFIYSVIRRQ